MSGKKAYVEKVSREIAKKHKQLLLPLGVNTKVVGMLDGRLDVFAKLAYFIMLTQNYSKGANGLKRQPNFAVFGYSNFGIFNKNGRADVDSFKENLPDDASENSDKKLFDAAENTLAIMILPEDPDVVNSMNVSMEIATGRSMFVPFEKAVRSEYKIPGAFYLVLVFGDSFIKDIDKKKASMKASAFASKVAKRNPSVIKSEFGNKVKMREELGAKITDDNALLAGEGGEDAVLTPQNSMEDILNFI